MSIPLYKVHMPDNMADILRPVLLSGFISEGPKAEQFEVKFQNYIGNPNTALVNSCTSAITLALRLAGVGVGDEVITSPLTCLATNSPILNLGADLVWCDIDKNTLNIDADKIESLITPKTKAILFVDWGGTPAELGKINAVAKKYNLKTIEDSAQSLGSKYKGKMAGTCCDYTCFSFQAIKHLSTGDGGAIACRTAEDYEKAVLLRWFGLNRKFKKTAICWDEDVPSPGYKMHMNDINATIGLEQLKYIDGIIGTHNKNGRFLLDALMDVPNVKILSIPDYIDSSFWFFTILLKDTKHREVVSEGLRKRGVGCHISHVRNDLYSMFSKYTTHLPVLDLCEGRKLNIPCGWWLSASDLEYIVTSIREVS